MSFEPGRIRFRNADMKICDEPVAGEETLCGYGSDQTRAARHEGRGASHGPPDQVRAGDVTMAQSQGAVRQTAAPEFDTRQPESEQRLAEYRQERQFTDHSSTTS